MAAAKKIAAKKAAPKVDRRKSGEPKQFWPADNDKIIVGIQVASGMTQVEICKTLINPSTGRPISAPTFREHFGEGARIGKALAGTAVAKSLFSKAINEECTSASVSAAIFWLKTQGGWKETTINEVKMYKSAQDLSDDELAFIATRRGHGAADSETGEE